MINEENILRDYRYIILNDYKEHIYDNNWRFFFKAFLKVFDNYKNGYGICVENNSFDIDYMEIKSICNKYNMEVTLISDKLIFYVSFKRICAYLNNNVFKRKSI